MSGDGKFTLIDGDDDNMDKILTAAGFGDDVKKISRNMRPSLEGRREGDKFTVKWTADGKELVQIFELGVETEYSTLDGRKAKSIYTMGPNNVLIQNETVDGKTIKYERQIIGDQMIMDVSYGGFTAKRIYKRV